MRRAEEQIRRSEEAPLGAWRRRMRQLGGIDERSLALFRIGLGLVVLADLASRAGDLGAHYSDAGVVPRVLAQEQSTPETFLFPLYFLHGSALWSLLLLGTTAAAALALVVGWRSRWSAAATWFLVSCLTARTELVTHSGDDLLRLLLLWSVLLPLGAAFSLDDRRLRRRHTQLVLTPATVAVQVHLSALFLTDALGTADEAPAIAASTVLGALHLDHLATAWGIHLRDLEPVMQYAGLTVGGLELVGPALLWLPLATGPIRFFVVLTFWQLHLLGVAPALRLGILPWAAAVAWILFLPGWLWNQFTESRWDAGRPEKPRGSRVASRAGGLAACALLLVAGTDLAARVSGRSTGFGTTVARVLGLVKPAILILPEPDTTDGWYVVPGELADGSTVDAWRKAPLTLDKPAVPSSDFRNPRWAALLMRLASADYDSYRRPLLQHLCRSWNRHRADAERLSKVELVFMLERFDPAAGESRPLPMTLASGECPPSPSPNRQQKTGKHWRNQDQHARISPSTQAGFSRSGGNGVRDASVSQDSRDPNFNPEGPSSRRRPSPNRGTEGV